MSTSKSIAGALWERCLEMINGLDALLVEIEDQTLERVLNGPHVKRTGWKRGDPLATCTLRA